MKDKVIILRVSTAQAQKLADRKQVTGVPTAEFIRRTVEEKLMAIDRWALQMNSHFSILSESTAPAHPVNYKQPGPAQHCAAMG